MEALVWPPPKVCINIAQILADLSPGPTPRVGGKKINGLACALRRYVAARDKFGLEALLLGQVDASQVDMAPAKPAGAPAGSQGGPQGAERFKLKCPQCESALAFEEGCAKCYGCGYSQC